MYVYTPAKFTLYNMYESSEKYATLPNICLHVGFCKGNIIVTLHCSLCTVYTAVYIQCICWPVLALGLGSMQSVKHTNYFDRPNTASKTRPLILPLYVDPAMYAIVFSAHGSVAINHSLIYMVAFMDIFLP